MHERVSHQKGALRRSVLAERRAMGAAALLAADRSITARLAALVTEQGARRVACYLSGATEPGTRGFLAWAAARDVEVLVPVALPSGMLNWVELRAGWLERRGAFGVGEATGPRLGADAVADTDLVLVPAAAVDRAGARLGWGRGYYDRALATLPQEHPVHAVVFDREFVDALPTEAHDRPVSGVVTPNLTARLPCGPDPRRS